MFSQLARTAKVWGTPPAWLAKGAIANISDISMSSYFESLDWQGKERYREKLRAWLWRTIPIRLSRRLRTMDFARMWRTDGHTLSSDQGPTHRRTPLLRVRVREDGFVDGVWSRKGEMRVMRAKVNPSQNFQMMPTKRGSRLNQLVRLSVHTVHAWLGKYKNSVFTRIKLLMKLCLISTLVLTVLEKATLT